VSYYLNQTRPGLDLAQVDFGLVRLTSGTTLVSEYADVIWFPARSAAEDLDAALYRSVTITATADGTIPAARKKVTKTFTSASTIARLVGVLNASPAAPRVQLYLCAESGPAIGYSFQLSFDGRPPARVMDHYCLMQVWTAGARQPMLTDQGGLSAMAAQLLRL
jgi:hypothetical protein